jgi:hypothetical protein
MIRAAWLCVTALLAAAVAPRAAGTTWYVDCASGDDTASGASPASAWRSIERANRQPLTPGDTIALKRAARCRGMLSPQGSGTEDAPLTLGAYGRGTAPLIDGGTHEAAIKLFNQEHWRIRNLETTGGTPHGILIAGDRPVRGFRIENVAVHDVSGEVKTKQSGLIVVRPAGPLGVVSDVVIDGVTAWNTTQWAGIIVAGAPHTGRQEGAHGANVTVRNSTVHDVHGDGIVLFSVRNGRIEKSVAWNTGLQPTETIGTPNGIWTWMCDDCVVEYNEGYLTSSPGVDAGVYDIDWGCRNNTVQFNYGHDARGYCVAVFGAGGLVTANSVVRGNVCARNGRDAALAARQGDVFLQTWDNGKLDGVRISDNYIRWSPAADAPALHNTAEASGSQPNTFENNTIVSAVPSLILSAGSLKLDGNRYRYEGAGLPKFSYGGAVFSSFDTYRLQTGQDQHGSYGAPDPRARTANRYGVLTLVSVLDDSDASHSQSVFLRSMHRQYGKKGLRVRYAGDPSPDWHMDGIPKLPGAPPVAQIPTTLLLDGKDGILKRWEGFVPAQDLAMEIEASLPGATP